MSVGKVVLALDGMGGDNAPEVVVNGADIARERYPGASFLLFGDPARLKPLVDRRKGLAQALEIVPAEDAVSPDDKPSFALRRRRQSSMWLAVDAAAQGRADTVVSAGNTGALLAISMVAMRMLEGAHRPALASFMPTNRGETVMLDLGANLECDAENLAQFAVMGSVFAQVLLGLSEPTVGLLNVGSEELKGHEELRQAAMMLRREGSPVSFHGFVEGNDIGAGKVDVVVTDGFTGNVALKTIEGTAKLYTTFVREAFRTSTFAKIGALFAAGALVKMRKRVDPRRYNGGVFVGLDGVCVKSHGGTDALGFAYAIGMAIDMVRYEYKSKLVEGLAKLHASSSTEAAPALQAGGGSA
ncbi:MAG: phosphate acyltransferase PlsX [Reyranella sp.]|uniref:phosphate acyltransferase PlsX n=1 Tax=Bradyrhizobium sp. TaxID=376 RepID=UPI00272FB254|nr:phosphate acyltransferase PlsX [Bradyrhizobium sp.]MDP1865747.1 phosphate acyltransferase PlsX [Bradyrhizobium sp.]MDP3161180.1 phosphate acyltransferase PlsX [Reyranella sp.]